jgi:transposase
MSGHTFLHRIMRDEVITLLLESGLSIREAARAVNASVGTVAGVKARAAQPGGESAGTESTPVSATAKLVTQVTNALTKLTDKVADLSDDDVEKLRKLTLDTSKKLAAMQKLRVQIAEAQKPEAEAPAPKPGQRVKTAA